ncbi:MAG: hypothetical protein EHM49_00660 [Deltaproteobacteria bacterium]|nr:MAG: hypothetical protein EHM49_00660 [Deltaproteobacteria bacterium]
MDRCLQENSILRELVTVKDQQISNLEKEVELKAQEVEIKDRIIAVKDMEIAATQRALDQMKDVSDRAIKLAEVSQPKTGLKDMLMPLAIIIGAMLIAIGL